MWLDIWYDRHLKMWTIQMKDKEGNQVGNAEYAPNRQAAKQIGELMMKEGGIPC